MQDKLIARAKELLAEGKVQKVVGWKKGLFEDDITPAVFNSAEELSERCLIILNCAASLIKLMSLAISISRSKLSIKLQKLFIISL